MHRFDVIWTVLGLWCGLAVASFGTYGGYAVISAIDKRLNPPPTVEMMREVWLESLPFCKGTD